MTHLLEQCRDRLADHYGDRFAGLVLYGSEARGEATPDSDIELLVLLRPPFDFFREREVVIDLLYPLQLESDRLIFARPADEDTFEHGRLQLYPNAKREGLRIPAHA